jgi:uncharacterized oligopeptide transporter (OPT) family protein
MIKQLNDEQIRTMSLAEKDRWWLANVWRGDEPQLTVRSGIAGMLIGGLLSLTNLYVGIKTGWTLGVGITSVIFAFAVFKLLSRFQLSSEITLLENNAMQSIATAAGYMTAPLISNLSAYMMVTGQVIPLYQSMTWMPAIALLGVLFAFPLKKRFINEEQLPFPEGKACGIVLDGLHSENKDEGALKTRLLAIAGGASALWTVLRSHGLMTRLRLGALALPDYFDQFVYRLGVTPRILGTKLSDLTIRWETDFVMAAAGGLMGIRTGVSLMIGACINYFILAPILIQHGVITPDAKTGALGFKQISLWSLWGGVAMMTTSSLYSFFSKPKVILSSFAGLLKRGGGEDVLKDIELPMRVFVFGIPVVGLLVVALTHVYFGVSWLMAGLAIPLIFVFTLIAVNATGLTSITPTGALGKLTQLTYAALDPGNITTNLMTAGINGAVASNASNLLMDIKPGYMLGGKPRHQAMGHVLGIISGALVAPPIFYWMFRGDTELLGGETLPLVAAKIWVAVAEILTRGLSFLDVTARWAILIGAVLGVVFELVKGATKNRFPLTAVGFGLAFVLQFYTSFSMFLGAALFWLAGKKLAAGSKWRPIFVDNTETICAGVIAGGSIMGIVAIVLS